MQTRREFLGMGAGLAAGAVGLKAARFVGHSTTSSRKASGTAVLEATTATSPSASLAESIEVHRFYSRTDLRPPRVRTWAPGPYTFGGASGAYVLLTPHGYTGAGPGQQGLMILDGDGRLRWFLPTAFKPFDLQRQQYNGKAVLTWWEGNAVYLPGQPVPRETGPAGGEAVVADMTLREIARIGEVDGLYPDLHELNLTPEGTALVTANYTVATSLSAVGGPAHGYAEGGVAVEVDVATGKLVHRWDSLDHVPVSDSYQKFSGGTEASPFDYFHINSICLADDGDLLISARNTWTVYKVGRSSGEVKWRLNGKRSDFKMGAGSHFYWQHHVRQLTDQRVTVFDDGASPAQEAQSRALVLHVDEAAMVCSLERAFTHPARLLAPNQGSVQVLGDGGAFVGWGAQPYFSRFSAEGEVLADGRLPDNVSSYRAFVANLTTAPTDKPALAVGPNAAGGSTAYVSWNGATEVKAWRVLAGQEMSHLTVQATQNWADFETAVSVNSYGPYFQAVALDDAGRQLRSSETVKI